MTPDELNTLAEALPVVGVVQAWRTFKRTHDLADAKTCCCPITQKLFDRLDELERDILALEPTTPHERQRSN